MKIIMARLHHIASDNLYIFLTFVAHDRRSVFYDESCANVIRDNFNFYRNKFGLSIPAYVLMPDHLQFIVGIRKAEDLQKFVHDFKSYTAQQINRNLRSISGAATPLSRQGAAAPDGGQFWQKDYWDHGIRNEKDLIVKVDYIHKNPKDVVEKLEDWPYSSYHNYYCTHPCWFEIDRMNL